MLVNLLKVLVVELVSTLIILVSLSLFIWLFLLIFWGNFWRSNQYVDDDYPKLKSYPKVAIIVPARDEADVIEKSIESLLTQKYLGNVSVVLIDDNSCDRTAEIALKAANQLQKSQQLKIISRKAPY